jgi:predicted protein tyrosine phosphatase
MSIGSKKEHYPMIKFRICGEMELVDHLPWATHVVSIWSPGERHDLMDFPQPETHICRVDFDDVIIPTNRSFRPGPNDRPPQEEDIQKVIAFFNELPESSNVLFHCQAGISRSTATAFVALCARYPTVPAKRHIVRVWQHRQGARPNTMVVAAGDRVLEQNGQLSEVADWFNTQMKGRGWCLTTRIYDPLED